MSQERTKVRAVKVVAASSDDDLSNIVTDDSKSATVRDDDVSDFLQNVKQAAVRRLSAQQIHIRASMIHKESPAMIARKHINEKWTHTILVCKLLTIAVLSIALMLVGKACSTAAIRDSIDSSLGDLMATLGIFMICSAIVGAYGANCVRNNLKYDDDGFGTSGQHLLQVYFHIAFGCTLLVLPCALAALTDPDNFLNGGSFGDTEFYGHVASVLALVIAFLTIWSLHSTVIIVTVYEMSHSFLEFFSTVLVFLGVAGIVLCLSLREVGRFMTMNEETVASESALLAGLNFFTVLCVLLVLLSMLGFGAAVVENNLLLKIHIGSMSFLFFSLVGLLIAASVLDLNSLTEGYHCRNILGMMSEDWWQDTIKCPKYGGAAMGAQVELYDKAIGEHTYKSSGAGDSARCPLVTQNAFAWEYHAQGLVYEGCLNLACCDVLTGHIAQHLSIIRYGLVVLSLCVCIALRADFWLLNNSPPQSDRVKLISSRKTKMLLSTILVFLVGGLVCLSVQFTSSATSVAKAEVVSALDTDNLVSVQRLVVVPFNQTKLVHSCSNRVLDGNETDVDCGGGGSAVGGCDARCAINKKCRADNDCKSGKCNATAANVDDVGLCRAETQLESCSNGLRDGSETGVDCGGDRCRALLGELFRSGTNESLDLAEGLGLLCPNGDACGSDLDCLSGSCTEGICTSCHDGVRNAGEGDIDCGSTACVGYFEQYPNTPVSNISGVVNAAPNGLCLDSRRCSSPDQCASGVCNEELQVCVSCSNELTDGDEADIDCGGRVCDRRCSVDQHCRQNYDCATRRCSVSCSDGNCDELGTCLPLFSTIKKAANPLLWQSEAFIEIAIKCNDGVLSIGETDVDCGGELCQAVGALCADSKRCSKDEDCASSMCSSGQCVSCENGIMDGVETGVDCGGARCTRRCFPDQGCQEQSDCRTGSFCWTKEMHVQALAVMETAGILELSLFFPDVYTCQPIVTMAVETQDTEANAEGSAQLWDLFGQPNEPAAVAYEEQNDEMADDDNDEMCPEEADECGDGDFIADYDNNASRRVRRILLTGLSSSHRRVFGRRRNFLALDPVAHEHIRRRDLGILEVESDTNITADSGLSLWGNICSCITVFDVPEGFRFVVENIGPFAAAAITENGRKLTVSRTFNSQKPTVRIEPTSCQVAAYNVGRNIRVSSTSAMDGWCSDMYTFPVNQSIAEMRTLRDTLVQGRVYTNGNVDVSDAMIRMWTTYDSNDTNVTTNVCSGDSLLTSTLVQVTDSDGWFSIRIPTLVEPATGSKYRLEFGIFHDDFVSSQGSNILVDPGATNELASIYLSPATLQACGCKTWEEPELNMPDADATQCHNPVTQHCKRKVVGEPCSHTFHLKACANDVTKAPTSAPTVSKVPKLTRGHVEIPSLTLAPNWNLTLSLRLEDYHPQWTNILHRGNNNEERIPGLWIRPGELRLIVRVGANSKQNEGCDLTRSFELYQWYDVVVQVQDKQIKVLVNGEVWCQSDIHNDFHMLENRKVYISDPWYEGMRGIVKNVQFEDLPNSTLPPTIPAFPVLEKGRIVDNIVLGHFWRMTFKLTVYGTGKGVWRSLIHVGDNNRRRVPAVWLRPHTNKLHVRSGTTHNWNAGADPSEILELGQEYEIKVECLYDILTVYIDGQKRAIQAFTGHFLQLGEMPVYVSNPWYVAAEASISQLTFTNITGVPTKAPTITIPQLTKGKIVGVADLKADWRAEFAVTVHDTVKHYSNIFHVGSRNQERLPAVWLYPGSSRLHIRAGVKKNWNFGCDPKLHLMLGQRYEVVLEYYSKVLSVFIDGNLKCSARGGDFVVKGPLRLYVSDPWHAPAKVVLEGPVFHDIVGKPTISPTVPGSIKRGRISYTVNLHQDWVVEFQIKLEGNSFGAWRNVFHVGDENKQRIPAMWLYPHSNRAHIRVGTIKSWNFGCDPTFILIRNIWYDFEIRLSEGKLTVKIDNVKECETILDAPFLELGARNVYISDPWHAAAEAELAGLTFTNLITQAPTTHPSAQPTSNPTMQLAPSAAPTTSPSKAPNKSPTKSPSKAPSKAPTKRPSLSPTVSPSLSPTRSPSNYPTSKPTENREPFASMTFSLEDFSWVQTGYETMVDFLARACSSETGDRSFASVSGFVATWEEVFDLDVASNGACTNLSAVDFGKLKEALAEARCGTALNTCSAEASVDEFDYDVLHVKLSVSVATPGDAYGLDSRLSSPGYIENNGVFYSNLNTIAAELGDLTNCLLESPAMQPSPINEFDSSGTVTLWFAVEDNFAYDLDNKIIKLMTALEGLDFQASEEQWFLLLPNAHDAVVDRCPIEKVCSGNGFCINDELTYSVPWAMLGLCNCNETYKGHNCAIYVPPVVTTSGSGDVNRTCTPRGIFGGTGASIIIWDICREANPCESQAFYCELIDAFSPLEEMGELPSGCPGGSWLEVFHQVGCDVSMNLGGDLIDAVFDLRKVWRYDISGVPYLYYEFIQSHNSTNGTVTELELPEGFSAYSMMTDEWSSLEGKHLINNDFRLFQSAADMEDGVNAWAWSNYNDAVGFPRDARPHSCEGGNNAEHVRRVLDEGLALGPGIDPKGGLATVHAYCDNQLSLNVWENGVLLETFEHDKNWKQPFHVENIAVSSKTVFEFICVNMGGESGFIGTVELDGKKYSTNVETTSLSSLALFVVRNNGGVLNYYDRNDVSESHQQWKSTTQWDEDLGKDSQWVHYPSRNMNIKFFFNAKVKSVEGLQEQIIPSVCNDPNYARKYRHKWAKSYCGVPGRTITPVAEFSFHLCLPNGPQTASSGSEDANSIPGIEGYVDVNGDVVQPVRRPPQTFTLSGSVSESVGRTAVAVRVMVFKGNNIVWESQTALHDAEFTPAATDDSDSPVVLTTCSADQKFTAADAASASGSMRTTFSFAGLTSGTYTAVFTMPSDSRTSVFKTKIVVFNVEDDDTVLDVSVLPELPEGSLLAVLETKAGDLDLVLDFISTAEGQSCQVSSKLLSDAACSCSGAQLLRVDTSPSKRTGLYSQILLLSSMRETSYHFSLARNRPLGQSTYKKHRDDGRCGPNFPLENGGGIAQCSPVPMKFSDGTNEHRPCCNIVSGRCGSDMLSCKSRWSVDYRMFLDMSGTDDSWTGQTREDGKCNIPQFLSSRGKTATCPEDRPCCSPHGRCGMDAYACESFRSIDYRPFYTLLKSANNATMATITSTYTSVANVVEESESTISLFSPNGLVRTFTLPDPNEPINYFDRYTFVPGRASSSSSYTRMFCVDALQSASGIAVHEYPSPRWFEFQGRMIELSKECPPSTKSNKCAFIKLAGMRLAFVNEDGTKVPELNGIYVQRSSSAQLSIAQQASYKMKSNTRLNHRGACRVKVLAPDVSKSADQKLWKRVWYMDDDDSEDLSRYQRACMEMCSAHSACQAVWYRRILRKQTKRMVTVCTFHKNVKHCGGASRTRDWHISKHVVFYKRSVTPEGAFTGFMFTLVNTMFKPKNQQVHLYRDNGAGKWFFDNDFVPGNGYFSTALDEAGSSTDVPKTGWRYVNSFSATDPSQTVLFSHNKEVNTLLYRDDCGVDGNTPTLSSTAVDSGCQCTPGGNCLGVTCDKFQIKLQDSDICIEADAGQQALVANVCDIEEEGQFFMYNSLARGLEVSAARYSYSSTVCEWRTHKLVCSPGEIIKVRNVFYGRTDKTVCTRRSRRRSVVTTTCGLAEQAANTLQVQSMCDGKQSCSFAATNGFFKKDPCVGIFKFSKVDMECEPENVETDVSTGDKATCDDVWNADATGADGQTLSCGTRIEALESTTRLTLSQAKTQIATDFTSVCGPCKDLDTTLELAFVTNHFVVIESGAYLGLGLATSATISVEGAAEIRFPHAQSIIEVPVKSEATSYTELEDNSKTRCIVLNAVPGDEPLIVDDKRSHLCSAFSVV